ncbi:MAG TPA: hypothetical protein VHU62_15830 [Mycobacterium sp.]|nr:hypothetical protein [Mycobacterium sp.]
MIPLGPIGLASSYPYTDDAAVVADEAQHVESLGFSTLWRSGNLPMIEAAVRATTSIPVATGIIPVDSVPAADVVATYESLQRDHPGRFIVGVGGAHGARPVETLNVYLDELDSAGIGADARVHHVSDRLLDGITAWGDVDAIAARVGEYLAAGADQVVLRLLGADDERVWRARLAEALIG